MMRRNTFLPTALIELLALCASAQAAVVYQ